MLTCQNSEAQEEENEAICAIYGDAISIDSSVSSARRVVLRSYVNNGTAVFNVSQQLPAAEPTVQVECDALTALPDVQKRFYDSLKTFTSTLDKQEPFLLDLFEWMKETLESLLARADGGNAEHLKAPEPCKASSCSNVEGEKSGESVILVKLDHMRDKGRYCRTLRKWADELGLCGGVFTYKRLVFWIVAGENASVKEFARLSVCENVDVNRAGKPCKERMYEIVCERSKGENVVHISLPFSQGDHGEFAVFDAATEEELRQIFGHYGLMEEFETAAKLRVRFH
uniref:RWD domain-containing protein 3 n=1 Tax=Palpitomonas bilix TaxID=652834 RepID=A0A7S3GEK3_9EUKA|mmetsp:Transcript_46188/g.119033  ORF Transcript_46188/g.119033 Transcript_46188/m.119033 type:complete len:285 (+) Transcript_46188:126-980(+)